MIGTFIACATCASNFEGGETGSAAGWSILFMLGVILAILGGVVGCMIRIACREREALDPELRDDYDPNAVASNS